MDRIRNEAELEHAISRLIAAEPRFARIYAQHGLPPLRHVQPGLKSLLRIVTDQLISLKAGEAIWRRVETAIVPFESCTILAHGEPGLRQLGLSGGKARTFVSAAAAFATGTYEHDALLALSDDRAAERLMLISGIGPWTAQIYLLSALQAADAWAAGDLALQAGAEDLLGLSKRPSARVLTQLAEPWRPWRSAAARLLWGHYRGLKGFSQAII